MTNKYTNGAFFITGYTRTILNILLYYWSIYTCTTCSSTHTKRAEWAVSRYFVVEPARVKVAGKKIFFRVEGCRRLVDCWIEGVPCGGTSRPLQKRKKVKSANKPIIRVGRIYILSPFLGPLLERKLSCPWLLRAGNIQYSEEL